MRRDPESVGLTPDGDATVELAPAREAPGCPLRAAVTTPALWLLGATFTATWIPVFIPLVHLMPFTRDLGHSPLVGASVVSVLGAGAVVGRLSMGALSDRIGRKPTVAIAMAMQALAFLGFLAAHGLPVLYAATLAFGYSYDAISTLFTAVVGDFFGRAHAGTIVGFLFAVAGSMAAWGPVGAGAIYDAWGTYDLAFALAAACNLLARGLLALAHPPQRQAASETRVAVPQTIE